MLLGGLWHGANWTFVVWGAFHGSLLAFERGLGKRTVYEKFPKSFRVAITFMLVLFSWVFFRSPSLSDATAYLGCMFGFWVRTHRYCSVPKSTRCIRFSSRCYVR